MAHKPDGLKHFEVSVNGREVEQLIDLLRLPQNLVRRAVLQHLKRVQDGLTLRGDPVAVIAQPITQHRGIHDTSVTSRRAHAERCDVRRQRTAALSYEMRLSRAETWDWSGCPTAAMS